MEQENILEATAAPVAAPEAEGGKRPRKKKNHFKRGKWGVFRIVMLLLLSIYSVTIIFLIAWVLLSSFKSKMDFSDYPLAFPPKFYFENYANIFRELSIKVTVPGMGQRDILLPELFLYSLLYSVGCMAVSIISKAMVAYVVAKYKFRFASVLYTVNIIVMIIPIVGRLPSELQLMRAIGFYDNLLALCIMKGSFTGMDFMLLHATFSSVPWEYAEAAKMDGASHFTIMWKVMFPMVKQVMLILALTNFITYWNDWNVNVTYMPSYPTAAYALYAFQNSNINSISLGGVPYILCACTVVMLPILVLFGIFNKQLLGEVSFGGIKG